MKTKTAYDHLLCTFIVLDHSYVPLNIGHKHMAIIETKCQWVHTPKQNHTHLWYGPDTIGWGSIQRVMIESVVKLVPCLTVVSHMYLYWAADVLAKSIFSSSSSSVSFFFRFLPGLTARSASAAVAPSSISFLMRFSRWVAILRSCS